MLIEPDSRGLGLPVVNRVDDEDVVRDALAWLLRPRPIRRAGMKLTRKRHGG